MSTIRKEDRRGIIGVGSWVVDTIKFIDAYPQKGNLTAIHKKEEGLGGCAHNVIVDIARLGTDMPLFTGGYVGDDEGGKKCFAACKANGIDASNLKVLKGDATSYTDVMTEMGEGAARTFFHYRGPNAKVGVKEILDCKSSARIFHLGYLLAMDEIDKADSEYGVAAARALDGLQKMGYETSVDMVSEEGDRYRKVVLPCLKYTDYLIVNEVEAGKCLGRELRESDGSIDLKKVEKAAADLLKEGVCKMVVIHFPEGGAAATKDGKVCSAPSFSPAKKDIISTVGAGDAFCAGALFAIHEGYELRDLLDFASACARFNLFNATSTGGAPTIETVQDFIKKARA